MSEQKSVLITGCSSGIGLCTARGLAQRGYRVFATCRQSKDVDRLVDEGLESMQLDVTVPASIRAAVEQVLERTGGRLYGLFNNAGYGQGGAVEDLSREALRAQFETNVFGGQELARHIVPVMRRQGEGRIIQNSSVLGFIAMKYRGAYTASKYALEGLSETLRMELGDSGVYVSLIEPGPIRSAFRKNAHAAFEKHIDREHSFHRDVYQAVERRLANQTYEVPFTLGPEAVLHKVIKALESRSPKARYYVTAPTYGFAMLKRVLPGRLFETLLIKASGAENRRG